MHDKIILRLESQEEFKQLPKWVMNQLLDPEWPSLNQEQANYRVAIFRDEIMDKSEYMTHLKKSSPKSSTLGL
jgi:hypothetical protein